MDINRFILAKEAELKRPVSVGFLGLGVSNLALIKRLSTPVCFINLRTESELCEEGACISSLCACKSLRGTRFFIGESCFKEIFEDILFLSPSVRRDRTELRTAAARGTVLSSDTELFFLDSEGVLGVSGSDGKSTTVKMAEGMLLSSGINAVGAGNCGTPFSDTEADVTVAELSSFMLSSICPRTEAAVITSLSPNHLNWHTDLEEYYSAKLNLLTNTERIILNADDEASLRLVKGRIYGACSFRQTADELSHLGAKLLYTVEDGYILRNRKRMLPVSELSRREDYNIKNALLAAALTEGYATERGICELLRSFRGLAHRTELIDTVGGVGFIDSSIDTTPRRTAATLSALRAPVLLLLGGRGKGLDTHEMLDEVGRYAVRIAIYGEVREEFDTALGGCEKTRDIPREKFLHFEDAAKYLFKNASSGQTVLLSPAATAYGEFRDFNRRGDAFRALVNQFKKTSTI